MTCNSRTSHFVLFNARDINHAGPPAFWFDFSFNLWVDHATTVISGGRLSRIVKSMSLTTSNYAIKTSFKFQLVKTPGVLVKWQDFDSASIVIVNSRPNYRCTPLQLVTGGKGNLHLAHTSCNLKKNQQVYFCFQVLFYNFISITGDLFLVYDCRLAILYTSDADKSSRCFWMFLAVSLFSTLNNCSRLLPRWCRVSPRDRDKNQAPAQLQTGRLWTNVPRLCSNTTNESAVHFTK